MMPQASDEDRDLMEKWFGNMSDAGPTRLLESHGFELLGDWTWKRPTPSYQISAIEWACIEFLVDEWDYGLPPVVGPVT